MMMTIYLAALLLGGTFLLATFVLGALADADKDFDIKDLDAAIHADADVDVDADADVDSAEVDAGAIDAVLGWLPITSIRFWTFFTAFFGLTGASLTALDSAHKTVIGVVAALAGWIAGTSVVRVIRKLRTQEASSSVGVSDYMGATGVVMIKVAKGHSGQVRLKLKGRYIELMADTEDEAPLLPKQSVMIYGVEDDGKVMVTKAEKQLAASE